MIQHEGTEPKTRVRVALCCWLVALSDVNAHFKSVLSTIAAGQEKMLLWGKTGELTEKPGCQPISLADKKSLKSGSIFVFPVTCAVACIMLCTHTVYLSYFIFSAMTSSIFVVFSSFPEQNTQK